LYLIAGIDPGKTGGIACLDLNGRLVFRDHKSFGGLDWFISTLNKTGTPVIIASDKPEAGELVKKINTIFSSRLFCPEREFRLEEKKSVAKIMGIKNPHERDAYTAAMAAYRAYSNKFKQIEHLAHENKCIDIDQIKAKVVGKHSISEAMENRKSGRR